MQFITIDNLIKKIEKSSKIYTEFSEILSKNSHISLNNRIFDSNKTLENESHAYKYDFNQENPYKDRLLKSNHIYATNGSIHYRKWIFYGNLKDNIPVGIKYITKNLNINKDKYYILSNEYGYTHVVSRNIDERMTRVPILKNKNIDIWYLRILDKFNRNITSYKLVDLMEISKYIDYIENSNDILIKSHELEIRLNKILGNINFQNTFEFGWFLPNAYKISIKKYETDTIYLENKEENRNCRKVLISEYRLIEFLQKNRTALKEIEQLNTENNIKKYNQSESSNVSSFNDSDSLLIKNVQLNYNDMTVDYRIKIRKIIQNEHPELFIRKSNKRKYEIHSCKPYLKYKNLE